MAGAAGDEGLVIFVGQGENETEKQSDGAAEEVFFAAKNDTAGSEQDECEDEIDRGMGNFTERSVDEAGGFGELGIVGMRIGDSRFIGGVQDFRDEFFRQTGALMIGILGGHGGEVEDEEEPGNHY